MHEEMTLNAITTENIVATGDVGHRIDLEKLVRMHGGIYEPSQFPGAILRIRNHTTFLVFTNGKLVCVGSKKEDDARSALVDMQRILVTIGCLNSTMD